MLNKRLLLLVLCAFLGTTCWAAGQHQISEVTAAASVLDNVLSLVAEQHYAADLHGLDWSVLGQECQVQVQAAASFGEALHLIDNLLQKLGDSHCGVGHLDQAAQSCSPYLFGEGSVGIDIRLIEGLVVVTRTTDGSAAAVAGIEPGYTLTEIDGIPVMEILRCAILRPPYTPANQHYHQIEAVMWRLYGKRGTTVSVAGTDRDDRLFSTQLKRESRDNGIELYQGMPQLFIAVNAKKLGGAIDYIGFNAFQPNNPTRVLQFLDSLDQHGRLIVDLRGNNGGSAQATSVLLSRFFSAPFVAYERCGRQDTVSVTVVPSAPGYHGDVVILVDALSVSAAENFAAIMQRTGRARVVGVRTPGQLLWGEGHAVGDSVMAVIPTATVQYPDGTSIEGIGVEPDLSVTLRREDLCQDHDSQLDAAMRLLTNYEKISGY